MSNIVSNLSKTITLALKIGFLEKNHKNWSRMMQKEIRVIFLMKESQLALKLFGLSC